jgi:hypothetical protein
MDMVEDSFYRGPTLCGTCFLTTTELVRAPSTLPLEVMEEDRPASTARWSRTSRARPTSSTVSTARAPTRAGLVPVAAQRAGQRVERGPTVVRGRMLGNHRRTYTSVKIHELALER